ncbi:SPRY domain-containing SOCS box protein 3-like [Gigantopelta aegis]|uniref:SPRY domain-containing SOCS box protein 3-like n=1 Tax=Gigantopelta aegis TaxID=1735272 RepID=UPI001B888097|nr:SPRY domain-containing SOCS box protein 3-like [Gigantopelta aegis]
MAFKDQGEGSYPQRSTSQNDPSSSSIGTSNPTLETTNVTRNRSVESIPYTELESDEESDSDDKTFQCTPTCSQTDSQSSRIMSAAKPVKAETFCECLKRGKEKYCKCGEEDSYFDWVWDDESKSLASSLRDDNREVVFHVDYSCGTAAVRGSVPMKDDQYFWEVKMTTPVYGTDMMVGVGTSHIDLNRYRHMFCSMVGRDSESWGLSYTGQLQHKGEKRQYSAKFGQSSIIGVHLDMWHGILSFYKNRKPLGIAYRGLQGKTLYPMVSSTAARSGMKMITSRSFRTSLQFMCCQELRRLVPEHMAVLDAVPLPPGLKAFLENNMGWMLQPYCMAKVNVSRKRPLSVADDVDQAAEDREEGCPPRKCVSKLSCNS